MWIHAGGSLAALLCDLQAARYRAGRAHRQYDASDMRLNSGATDASR